MVGVCLLNKVYSFVLSFRLKWILLNLAMCFDMHWNVWFWMLGLYFATLLCFASHCLYSLSYWLADLSVQTLLGPAFVIYYLVAIKQNMRDSKTFWCSELLVELKCRHQSDVNFFFLISFFFMVMLC